MIVSSPFLTIVTGVLPSKTAHIQDTIDSVLRESSASVCGIEWIIVEDGSGSTYSLFAEPLSRMQGVWDCQGKQAGVSAARTRALLRARGEVILNLDADDILEKGISDKLQLAFASAPHVAAISGILAGTLGKAQSDDVRIAAQPLERTWEEGELVDNWASPFPFHPGIIAYRKETILSVGGWPALAGGEDRALVLMVNLQEKILSTRMPFLTYRLWDDQTTEEETYRENKSVYEKLTWMMIDARKRKIYGQGLNPDLPYRKPAK